MPLLTTNYHSLRIGVRSMKTREMLYAVLVVLGVLLPMYYNIQYMQGGGNVIAGSLLSRWKTLSRHLSSSTSSSPLPHTMYRFLRKAARSVERNWAYVLGFRG